MTSEDKAPSERVETDDNVTAQRTITDRKLRKLVAELCSTTDKSKLETRQRADRTRRSARAQTDAAHAPRPEGDAPRGARTDERRREDNALRSERVDEDETLYRELETQDLAIQDLLSTERASMDARLYLERSVSDGRLAARDNFLGMVSHDLRSMLAGIAMQAALMAREQRDDALGQRNLNAAHAIQRCAARMNVLIGDLLDVVGMESGKLHVVKQPHDATGLPGEAALALQPGAEKKGILIDIHVPASACMAVFDYERVLQVLANLLGNALKFTPSGGQVELTLTERKRDLLFVVADTGAGVPDDKRAVIFERFTQLEPEHHVGLGLGLYICKNIVEAHRGRIWVESRAGGGSRFCFTLPRARPAGRSASAARDASLATRLVAPVGVEPREHLVDARGR